MKVLLVSEYLIFDSIGGTEVYVSALAEYLKAENHDVYYLKSSDQIAYEEKNRLYTINEHDSLELRLRYFDELLSEICPDVVHFHTISESIGHEFLMFAKKKGVKTYYTSHTPDLFCLRGDLLYHGKSVCDGFLDKSKCLNCYKNSMPSRNYFLIQALSNFIRNNFITSNSENSFYKKRDFLLNIKDYVDKIIVVSNWQKAILMNNGITGSDICVVSQGVDLKQIYTKNELDSNVNKSIKIGFCGRIDAIKGLHILIDAFEKINNPELQLHIIGVTNISNAYYRRLREKTSKLNNVIWELNLSREEVFKSMSSFDVLCIPSQWFETGPFTMYEAFAMNIPVIASNLGGMSDNIIDNQNGLLFEYDNTDDLVDKIKKFSENEELRRKLKLSDKPKRDINKIGSEMIEIYTNEDFTNC